jgi:hypothetical protein
MIDFLLLSSNIHDDESLRHLAISLAKSTKKTIATECLRNKNGEKKCYWFAKLIEEDPAAEAKDLPEIEIGIVHEDKIQQAKIVTIESLLSQCLLNS